MSDQERYQWGPDVLEGEESRSTEERLAADAYVEAAVEDALDTVRRRGRPSLSERGQSPLLRVRRPRALDDAGSRAAKHARASRSEWVRGVQDEAVHRAS